MSFLDLRSLSSSRLIGIVFTLAVSNAPAAIALDDTSQLLSGGGLLAPFATMYTSPGLSTSWDINTPATGMGESAAQLRMSAGVLSNLKVKVTSQHVPASGKVTVTVRLNGGNTVLSCGVSGTGVCTVNKSINLTNASLLAIQATNNMEDGGNATYTYTLIYN